MTKKNPGDSVREEQFVASNPADESAMEVNAENGEKHADNVPSEIEEETEINIVR